jgi:hypothetical protein
MCPPKAHTAGLTTHHTSSQQVQPYASKVPPRRLNHMRAHNSRSTAKAQNPQQGPAVGNATTAAGPQWLSGHLMVCGAGV